MPTPVSDTLISTRRPVAAVPTRSRTTPPDGIACLALIRRLISTCWIWAGSTRARAFPVAFSSSRTRCLARSLFTRRATSSTSCDISAGSRSIDPVPSRARPSIPREMTVARCALSMICLRRSLAVRRIRVSQAKLGVVQNRGKRVVQFVENAAGQDAQAADALECNDLVPQLFNGQVASFRQHDRCCGSVRKLKFFFRLPPCGFSRDSPCGRHRWPDSFLP